MVFVICSILLGSIQMAALVFLMVVLVDLNVLACYYYTDMKFEFLTSIIM